MFERNEFELLMDEVIVRVSADNKNGVSRFLQANPYSSFEYYNFKVLRDKWDFFEKTLYCESALSRIYKDQICSILETPNGKNTFFIVGYQGCGKSTFIHSVINTYKEKNSATVVIIDCDKSGNDRHQIKKSLCKVLRNTVKNDINNIINFINFYRTNEEIIEEFGDDNFRLFYELIDSYNINRYSENGKDRVAEIKKFISSKLNIKEALYLIVLWNLAKNYDDLQKSTDKVMLFIDNLDCVNEYSELAEFVSCVDALTVEMSEVFESFSLCHCSDLNDTFVSKIKIFIAMRETTKANLPSSHFSDAFRSIYTSKDMTEWYDKGDIIKRRITKLLEFDRRGKLDQEQHSQLDLVLKLTEDSYTRNVIYPLFNNNYRSAVEMLVGVITSHTKQMQMYCKLMSFSEPKYRHGARGILFKCIFDELNKGNGNEESCFKRIGVLDLLNRKNNEVSICRLILSYLSNYTETKCDSGRNSISLGDITSAFEGLFTDDKVAKILCEMFLLRDSIWSHLVSFNQLDCENQYQKIDSYIDIKSMNPDRTMLHYSCAGKIYIEYVATHFEFFTARIFKNQKEALFSDSNLTIDPDTGNYMCYDIINRVYSEVEHCCESLMEFNIKLCNENNFLNPYEDPGIYKNSPYVCMFKRKEYDGTERRFKQFHEERIILTHINYIDSYRLYILNQCDIIDLKQKVYLNELLTQCITNYVQLLVSDMVLKDPLTYEKFVKHYIKQIESLQDNWTDFETEISKNN